ncbi:MAG: sulfite reductase, partial [Verrucomicrobiales bacterium]
ETVMLVQKDFGDRTDRAHARLKYTIDDRSTEWFTAEVQSRLSFEMEPPRDFAFEDNGDRFGWFQDDKGMWHLNLFISGGRVVDSAAYPLKTGLREIAKIHEGEYRLTTNQNLIIANISPEKRPEIEALLEKYKILKSHERGALRLNSISCVALPTCGLALAEAERYLPKLITELEEVTEECGLRHDAITIRMTGCPNGCGRPYLAEIAFVGKGPNKYNVYLGGGFAGDRLNKLYRESVEDSEIKALLRPIIEDYAKNREEGEHFGDFVIRQGYVAATQQGLDFHKNVKDDARASA